MEREIRAEKARTLTPGRSVEWHSVQTKRNNVLLEGPEQETEAVLRVLEPHLRTPVAWARPSAPFELPTGECGALVVRHVSALSREEQAQLLAWLDDPNRRAQVLSTVSQPLFPLVASGLFDEGLYYRLNVMLLHTRELCDSPDASQ